MKIGWLTIITATNDLLVESYFDLNIKPIYDILIFVSALPFIETYLFQPNFKFFPLG